MLDWLITRYMNYHLYLILYRQLMFVQIITDLEDFVLFLKPLACHQISLKIIDQDYHHLNTYAIFLSCVVKIVLYYPQTEDCKTNCHNSKLDCTLVMTISPAGSYIYIMICIQLIEVNNSLRRKTK